MENVFLKKNRGFTLLEVLIVIAIIGILVSLGVVSYSSAQSKSRDSRRRSDMKAVQNAWEQYYADNDGKYPATCSQDVSTYLPGTLTAINDPNNSFKDPKNSGTYVYSFTDAHCSTSAYCFCAKLESGTGNAAADPGSATCAFGAGSYYCVGSLQ